MVSTFRRIVFFGLACGLLFVRTNSGSERPELTSYDHEELLGRAERAFRTRNFLAAEKYYRELDRRLAVELSKLPVNEKAEQIEIDEELILAPFGLGHSLIYLHRYSEALDVLERGLKTYPAGVNSHPSFVFFQHPIFTAPVVSDFEERMKASSDPVNWLGHASFEFVI